MQLRLQALVFFAAAISAHASQQGEGTVQSTPSRQELATEFELLHAQPFVLDVPYEHTWRKDTAEVRSGYILVLAGKIERVQRHQVHEPVLYVGAQTAERINAPPTNAGETGRLVAIVPAPRNADGTVALDPWTTPIFLGAAVLPEEVDQERIQLELARARRLAIGPPTPARNNVGEILPIHTRPQLMLADRHALQLELASVIEFYSPLEIDLVEGFREPVQR